MACASKRATDSTTIFSARARSPVTGIVLVTISFSIGDCSMRDSAGPGGTDVYPVRKGILVGYGFSDDAAVLGWGFVQTWNP